MKKITELSSLLASAQLEEGEAGMSPACISVLGSDLVILATLKFYEPCIQLIGWKAVLHVLLLKPNSLRDGFQGLQPVPH